MDSKKAFTIYNASAGAGKTYTLVKAYLIKLLTGEYKDSYKNILAITFTNKAVAEMKTRVLLTLVAISTNNTESKYESLLEDISKQTGVKEDILKKKSLRLLKNILHNYAGFDILTIDTFTHRIIRTFARDLGIPMNFEIEMDTESLIKESVDALVAKIGIDKDFTEIIIDFALSKLEDDKSWDITLELNSIGRLLFSENDRAHLEAISTKRPADFKALKNTLTIKISDEKKKIKILSEEVLTAIEQKGVAHKDFTRGSVPTHFQKLANGDIAIDFKAAWKQNIETASFYNKTLAEEKKEAIDAIRPLIEQRFVETQKLLSSLKLYQNCIHNIIPLSLLNAINNELQLIKKERSILLISEFNKIISEAIQDQPAPFIYERLGERYRDYFIDEFQDTSELQWNNMIPLIDNAIATETLTGKRGQVTIVGDAKQAIYRWRGGNSEQFIDLYLEKNPFSVKEKEVMNLPKNYRSYDTVINFNNDLFTFLSNDFGNEVHKKLYLLGNNQETNDKKGGYVNVSFIEAKNVAEEHEIYPERVHEIILELQQKQYQLNDICILTRRQKEGSVIADYLTEKGISIISSETLLLNNDPRVRFIIDVLTYSVFNDDLIAKSNMLHYIAERYDVSSKHSFLKLMIFADEAIYSNELRKLEVDFEFNKLTIKPFYNSVEYIINSFNLADDTPAYIQFFLDIVFSYTQKHVDGVIGFLSYWNKKKDTLSIVAPEGEAAVKIMTIHKSKGLEFPCVIYPYANVDIYKEIEPKTWMSVDKSNFNGFEEILINYNKDIASVSAKAEHIVVQRQSQLELDMLNLLYVALTRAETELYIISKKELNSKGESYSNKFSGKLINYLRHIGKWNESQWSYDFGDTNIVNVDIKKSYIGAKKITLYDFDKTEDKYKVQIVTNASKLWDTVQEFSIERGNLIHDLMASVYTSDDLYPVIENAEERGIISSRDKIVLHENLKRIITHPELKKYYTSSVEVMNERDIISKGKLYRPDRLVIDENGFATILDYKTGIHKTIYNSQIKQYENLLLELRYKVKYKILVYFDKEIILKYVD